MHILFLDWPCFGHDDVLNFFKQQHFTVTYFSHPDYNLRKSITFTQSVNYLKLKNLISAFHIIIFL